MIYRKLDENGDYTLGRRDEFHEDIAAVGQAIKTRLRLLLGEWWENTEDGLPLFEEVLNTYHAEGAKAERIDLIFSERILNTKDVSKILSFDSFINPSTRTYSAVCSIQTIYGEVFSAQINGRNGESLQITL